MAKNVNELPSDGKPQFQNISFHKKEQLTQAEAAKKLGTTQPCLNDVLKGKIDKCTVDRLVNMLAGGIKPQGI